MLTVCMLGSFLITDQEHILNNDNIRSDMLIKLLSYIIINRERTLTADELTEVLWQEDESNNPTGALKNLIYRLRMIMRNAFGEKEYILTGRGAYYWNPEIKVEVDAEEFERDCNLGKKLKTGTDDRLRYYEKALERYKGDFLSKYSSMHWVVPLTTYYHSLFLEIVRMTAKLYEDTKRYGKMERVCINALRYDPVDEQFHCMLIQSMIYQNKLEYAAKYYERAERILFSSLGIRKSTKLREVYEQLKQMKSEVMAAAIYDINQEMDENENPDGAYICGYPIFKEIYRLESRRVERLGLSEYILLITVSLRNAIEITGNERYLHNQLEKVMDYMEETLRESLRIGDVAARYSHSQYVILLPTLDYENSIMVKDRIINNMHKKIKNRRIQIKSDITRI